MSATTIPLAGSPASLTRGISRTLLHLLLPPRRTLYLPLPRPLPLRLPFTLPLPLPLGGGSDTAASCKVDDEAFGGGRRQRAATACSTALRICEPSPAACRVVKWAH